MHLLGEPTALVTALTQHLQRLPVELLAGVAPAEPPARLEPSDDLGAFLQPHRVYLIQSGLIKTLIDERPVMYLQEGDLVGFRQHLLSEGPNIRYSCDEPVQLQAYVRSDWMRHLQADMTRQEMFVQYLIGYADLLATALARFRYPEIQPLSGCRRFAAGEALIRQGDEAHEVFIILEGHAEARVDGRKVGDVHKDEVFGAMAIFTGERRSATVVACEPCTVMAIPKEQFLDLMQSNPQIAHSLIESMARRIDLLNREITRLNGLSSPREKCA